MERNRIVTVCAWITIILLCILAWLLIGAGCIALARYIFG